MLVAAAVLLSLERIAYVWIWRKPHVFQAWCRELGPGHSDPVWMLSVLFAAFKILQLGVFAAWCYVHAGVWRPETTSGWVIAIGAIAVAAGQILSATVFVRLGRTGVFYGNRFGRDVEWCEGFPFSLFRHPQYVGAVLSIWGLFLIMRFPEPDWVVLPALETVYYALGASLEQDRSEAMEMS